MAAKTKAPKTVFICSECGAQSARWSGQCTSCGAWNTISEELIAAPSASASPVAKVGGAAPRKMDDIATHEEARITTGMGELDRVLGGGIVRGGVMLIGGAPGIGKSTLLLQICANLSRELRVLYVSGEESARQIKLRAERLGVSGDNLSLLCENDLGTVLSWMQSEKPDVAIIDSIQTMNMAELASAPGSLTQVRECTAAITRVAKMLDVPTFVVGHVNKDGAIAGPRVMEHIVDCVMYFEGDRHSNYRMLRCAKNRYGATDEIGMFEMRDDGLAEVENPSLTLLSGRPIDVSGICVACTMEGTRPLLAEVQGLVTASALSNPRRMTTGFDNNRLWLLLAVLEKRAGYFFSNLDTYINVVGGLELDEPAADLPVALALMTGLRDKPVGEGVAAFGEIGLAGELRSVNNAEARVAEAARLGFTTVIVPHACLKQIRPHSDIRVVGVNTVNEAFDALL
ncbi:MAG: DNA repair protein RadA [Clostridia bacterium]|nr:DNA repair protein RadA [Clostridia bacterium]